MMTKLISIDASTKKEATKADGQCIKSPWSAWLRKNGEGFIALEDLVWDALAYAPGDTTVTRDVECLASRCMPKYILSESRH